LLTAIAVASVAAGCGSSNERMSRAEYLQRLRAIEAGPRASEAGALFFKLVVEPGLSRNPCATQARRFHDDLDAIVDEVASLEPPTDVQELQDRFVAAARRSVGAVGRAAGDAEAGRLRCGTAMNERIYGLPSTQRAEEVLQELARKGYVLGLNAPD
jgi:hypothetical protein